MVKQSQKQKRARCAAEVALSNDPVSEKVAASAALHHAARQRRRAAKQRQTAGYKVFKQTVNAAAHTVAAAEGNAAATKALQTQDLANPIATQMRTLAVGDAGTALCSSAVDFLLNLDMNANTINVRLLVLDLLGIHVAACGLAPLAGFYAVAAGEIRRGIMLLWSRLCSSAQVPGASLIMQLHHWCCSDTDGVILSYEHKELLYQQLKDGRKL